MSLKLADQKAASLKSRTEEKSKNTIRMNQKEIQIVQPHDQNGLLHGKKLKKLESIPMDSGQNKNSTLEPKTILDKFPLGDLYLLFVNMNCALKYKLLSFMPLINKHVFLFLFKK